MYFYLIPLTLVVFLYLYFTRNFNFWKNKNVAGPKPVVFFGNIMDSVIRRKHLIMVYKDIYAAYPNEKVVGMYRMTTPCLMLKDLDIIKDVLVKDFELFVDRGVEFSEEGLGANIFHADGDRWRVLRHRFTPLFTSGKLKNMLHLITNRGEKFVKHLEEITNIQTEQPIKSLVEKFTMASIGACVFGIDLDENMFETLGRINKILSVARYGIELDMMYPGILKKFGGSLFSSVLSKFFQNLIKSVIEQRNGMPTNRKDFMDLILELRQQKVIEAARKNENEDVKSIELTDSIIAAQAFTFYGAGYESSSLTLTHMFYELAKNPDIQDRLVKEIDEVLERYNGELTYDALHEMTYYSQVFDETLRKYPVADLLHRNAQSDYKIAGTNITLHKGDTVIISAYGIHRDPKYYPNPEKFDPERFTPENVGKRHPCAYLPFGTGPRNCLGMRFAKWQSQVCTVMFLSKFRVEPSKNTPLELKYDPNLIFCVPIGGIPLNIVRR
ncbi:PREDICTED: cytochrome P450 6B5-like [Papilio xuthus]|uniref:unspecific monooxygenase n=1 Tax=Papilio xuthus TaxID=66420 RepID=A0AAJ6ZK14_PAPXU|nr:PREDICTED: cytochrome P450 6B5-like [Papilio xuthus]